MKKEEIKIAIQKEGRLTKPSEKFLLSLGLRFDSNSRALTIPCENKSVSLIKVRDDDIPKYVSTGVMDFGIVGLDVVKEMNSTVRIVRKLDFCECKMVIAVPNISSIKSVKDLKGKKIATSFPRVLGSFLKENRINSKIVVVAGSVELAPYLQTADAVCDITQTGRTLKEFSLKPIKTILKSQAVLITSLKRSDSKIFKFN